MSAGFQVFPQFDIVIDFTITDYIDVRTFVSDRLLAASQINNAQTPHTDTSPCDRRMTLIIRTAMNKLVGHSASTHFSAMRIQSIVDNSNDATHLHLPSQFGCSGLN
jgi:hypothetical protein